MSYSVIDRKPLISVVTVVRNGKQHLERTILSVLAQTYEKIEYIIIDGGSADGTLDIIKQYQDRISYWSSGADCGIYDAMNKGIEQATGQWVNFMNAGDVFYDNRTVERIFAGGNLQADIIYGDHSVIYDENNSKVRKAGEASQLWKGMVFCHQSAFVKADLMKASKFNTANRIAADFEFLYNALVMNKQFHNSGVVISTILADGLSGGDPVETMRGQWSVVRQSSTVFMKLYYAAAFAWRYGKNMIRAMLPKRMENFIRARL